MKLIFLSGDPETAAAVEQAGVDTIMVDLEILGKKARQGHLDTVISGHTLADLRAVRRAITRSEVMVRINPVHSGSQDEIEACVAEGADRIMLPMFRHPDEVRAALDLIGGRCRSTLLVETAAALARLPQILQVPGVDDIHVGLNDLHLELRVDFMFELFSGGLLDHIAGLCRASNTPFGIGGVARLSRGLLPAELILSEHLRLGSSAVILSRDFAASLARTADAAEFSTEVAKLRAYLDDPRLRDAATMDGNAQKLVAAVAEIVATRRANRSEDRA